MRFWANKQEQITIEKTMKTKADLITAILTLLRYRDGSNALLPSYRKSLEQESKRELWRIYWAEGGGTRRDAETLFI